MRGSAAHRGDFPVVSARARRAPERWWLRDRPSLAYPPSSSELPPRPGTDCGDGHVRRGAPSPGNTSFGAAEVPLIEAPIDRVREVIGPDRLM